MFSTGQIVATRGVYNRLQDDIAFNDFVLESLRRHVSGDWGDLCEEDRKENTKALKHGYRLMSVYKHKSRPTIWIITEHDRSVTTILFPEEY